MPTIIYFFPLERRLPKITNGHDPERKGIAGHACDPACLDVVDARDVRDCTSDRPKRETLMGPWGIAIRYARAEALAPVPPPR
jgi:hypothetical protein